MSLLFTLAAFAVTLGILIVVHEYGHYIVARWCGVRVLRFSVGFGKPMITKKFASAGTEWVLAAFPLGGYVKMLDEREGPIEPVDMPFAFNSQSIYRRSAIVLAGPVANLLLAVLLYWFLFIYGVPGIKPVLGEVPLATPAAAATFHRGDTITQVGSEPTATWQDVNWILLQHAVQKAIVEIETRNERGEIATHQLDLSGLSSDELDKDFMGKLGLMRFQPDLPAKIGRILPDGVAAKAGLRVGDEILSVNQSPLDRWDELVQWVRQNPGLPLTLDIKRGGESFQVRATPDSVKENGNSPVGKIGASPMVDPALFAKLVTEVRYPVGRAFVQALRKTWDTSLFSLKMLGKMVTGQVSWKNISGPITIADYAGQSARFGWVPYISFLALISISLGVLNLLPIPLLDGGHLMYYMVEMIKGSPVSEKTMEIGQQIGIAVLLTLMLFAFYNDINRLVVG
ncbi:peptidase M50 membrane-associated zinc metallopeptidase [Sulfuricella denitrificans skB26]|uniref:Zinc metalloprotease n=1 Tax=Sulfuricella denitrificans (strain DSM 22764 / NBRC 105220 / skB26) TaxID=1163617 RepID=S6AL98_SULDS|nr:RIP metalloprotease RseP [Sulfuricella denitrificans]BAN35449.1 peptidase M50 membrane-associated zinc metallopeptidase [Sulfuricella denitrificans skB26]